MRIYYAPMEGITGYIYRNAFRGQFDVLYEGTCLRHMVDKFYTPFISPGVHKKLTSKEKNDLLPEHNKGVPLVPQILTNDAEAFLRTARQLASMGYSEVNLNLGCPSGTVVSKHKGSGMLKDTHKLDEFLNKIYEETPIDISIKTRIGYENVEEWEEIVNIYNQYPIKEMVIHPRLSVDSYEGSIKMEQFKYAYDNLECPVCYNGDIFTVYAFQEIEKKFPKLGAVMLGRGVMANPALVRQIFQGPAITQPEFVTFHDEIFTTYRKILSGDRNLLFKMKELWNYWGCMFEDGESNMRRIRKAGTREEYLMVVSHIIRDCRMINPSYHKIL